MSLTKFNGATNNIRGLADKPTLSASELKEKFDKTGDELKTYINNILTSELDTAIGNTYSKTESDTRFIKNGDVYSVTYTCLSSSETTKRIDLPDYFDSSNLYVLCSTDNSENNGDLHTYIQPYTSWIITRDQEYNNQYSECLTLVLYNLEREHSYNFVFMKIS